ncbi:MAG: hypothetical protein IT435_05640 [Phycisphaerales bacterium]|nr:hypothetical protein [Phycisphaerales bacterium]
MGRSNKVGELRVELTAGIAQFQKDLAAAGKAVDNTAEKTDKASSKMTKAFVGIGKSIVSTSAGIVRSLTPATLAIGAFMTVGVGYLAVRTIRSLSEVAETVDQVGKAGARLGLTIGQMSVLRFAASQAGIDFETLGTMASKALKTVGKEVAAGNTTMQLGRTSVQLIDINGHIRDTLSLIQDFARAIDRAGDPAKKLELSQRVFGKAGADAFVTMLNESGGALKDLGEQAEKARRLGVVFTDEQFQKLKDYGDAVDRVGQAWLGVKVKLMTEIAPVLTDLMDSLSLKIGDLPDTIKAAVGVSRGLAGGTFPLADRSKVRTALSEFEDASKGLLLTPAKEAGRVILTTFAEGLIFAIRAAAPGITDAMRDALGPVFNVIPGVDIEKSLAGQLKDAQAALAAYNTALDRTRALQSQMDNVHNLSGVDARTLQGELGSALMTARPGGEKPLMARVTALQAQIDEQVKQRAQATAQALDEAMNSTGGTIDAAGQRIREAAAKFDAAREELVKAYQGIAPPAQTQTQVKTDLVSLSASLDWFWARAAELGGKASAIGKKIAAGFTELVKFRTDLNTRYLVATSSEEEGKRVQLLARFAAEEAEVVKQFGNNADALAALREVQLVELKKFNADLAKEAAEKAKADKERREQEIRALLETVAPAERVLAEKAKIDAAFRDGLLDSKYRKNFEDYFFQLELQADHTFGGELSQTVWDFRNTFNDALVDMVKSGKYNFDKLADEFETALLRMSLMQLAVEPLFQGAVGFGRGLFSAAPSSAAGGNTQGPSMNVNDSWAAGGVVTSRTPFWAGGHWNEMGEKGPEAIVPLDQLQRGGGTVVNVYNQGPDGTSVQVEHGRGTNGEDVIDVLVLNAMNKHIDAGRLDRRLKGRFNIGPVASRR